ncbi:response regulator transcription factor [Halocella sp. SP3-1]|uniref:response regulator transcription factor n=1 Tax=Halocella sp. SP3-1 TaxID=2382161 RepID=UPI000F75DCFD|nr:response regulator transcription factor [Halocella sp. SP3-1]AZO94215.1 DNA-binding response regulator [Halocella sp. SP3-1]
MARKILVVDDEEKIRRVSRAFLENEGYQVRTAADGLAALKMVAEYKPDLLVLDLMLPGISGEEVCQRIRNSYNLPVIMLTAKGTEADKIKGFQYGADDYLVKPFSLKELTMRIRAVLRRSSSDLPRADVLVYNNGLIRIYPEKMIVEQEGETVDLTKTEFDIFYFLASNPGRVFNRDKIAERVMGIEFTGFDRTIDVHIKNIRKKLKLKRGQLIETVYGAGYKFRDDLNE